MKRQPDGIPAGGQFAPDRKAEPASTLGDTSRAALMRERLQPSMDDAGIHGLRQNLVWNAVRQGQALDSRTADDAWNALAHLTDDARSDAYRLRIKDSYDAMMLRRAHRDGAPVLGEGDESDYLEALSYHAQATGAMGVSLSARSHRRMLSHDVNLGVDADGRAVVVSMILEHDLARMREDGTPGQWVSNSNFNHHSAGPEAMSSVIAVTQHFGSAELGPLERLYSERPEPKSAHEIAEALEFFARNLPQGTPSP